MGHYKRMMQRRINRRNNSRLYKHNNNRINNSPIQHQPLTLTPTPIPKGDHIKNRNQNVEFVHFILKKWGNKLYALTKPYPIITTPNPTMPVIPIYTTNMNECTPSPSSQRHFIEEETLHLNDIKSTLHQSIPIPMHLNIDYFDNNVNYDSGISNIARILEVEVAVVAVVQKQNQKLIWQILIIDQIINLKL